MKTASIIIGTILIVIAVPLVIGSVVLRLKLKGEVKELIAGHLQAGPDIVSEEDIAGLPEPLQRYMRYAGVLGREHIGFVRCRQEGLFRMSPARDWVKMKAEQYSSYTSPHARLWIARMSPMSLFAVSGRERYYDGEGNMLIKLVSLFKVSDARDPEIAVSALITYLNDMVFVPTALLSDFVRWDPIDEKSARATIADHGLSAFAVFYFNEKGEIVNFVTEDRYMTVDGGYRKVPWSTPFLDYREMGGFMIPTSGEGIWHL
ncbi:MAG TPA: DUF6544 family protein [Spirochaetota bacterium]|nr:DUF6544 family protein [Spirochaetota bacterium]